MTTSQSCSAAGDGAYLAYYGNNMLYIYNKEDAGIQFGTNATERLNITSTGDIELHNKTAASTTDPITVDFGGQYTPDASITHQNLKVKLYSNGSSNDAGGLTMGQSGVSYVSSVGAGHLFYTAPSAVDTIAEKMRITHDGKILVAHTSSHADMHGKIQVCSNTSHGIDIARYTATPHPPYLNLFKSRNGTVGSNTATLASDNCGCITGYGNDGSGFHAVGSLNFECDEDSANDDMPGRFAINITADGGTTLTERFRIDKNGTTWFQKAQVDGN